LELGYEVDDDDEEDSDNDDGKMGLVDMGAGALLQGELIFEVVAERLGIAIVSPALP
jgi:hypothetical protein